jgi:acetyl esterase
MQRRYGPIDSSLAQLLGELAEQGLISPDPMAMPIGQARVGNVRYLMHLGAGAAEVASIVLRDIPGPAGPVPAKIIRPHGADIPAPGLLYLHGGGFAFGDLETHEGLARELAARSSAVVVMPHYRRTPEHPFPAAYEDSLAAWRWLAAEATCTALGLDHRRLGMAGDSAGGNLVLALCAALRDGGEALPAGAAIIYGMLSRRTDTRSHATYAAGPGLTDARLAWFWEQYLPGGKGGEDPRAVPWLAALRGLPPLALFVAECDILADDTWDFAERLAKDGVPFTLDGFPGLHHGVIQLSRLFPPASDALSVIARRITEMLGAPGMSA